jgi:hypothetical protein
MRFGDWAREYIWPGMRRNQLSKVRVKKASALLFPFIFLFLFNLLLICFFSLLEQCIQTLISVLQSNLEDGLFSLEAKVKKSHEMYVFCVDLLSKGKIQAENEYSHPITPLK